MLGRLLLGLFVVMTGSVAIWGAGTVLANQRRDEAVQRLLAQVSVAPDGATLDLASAFDLDWDRAIVIGPYWPGSVANTALGFDHYAADEVVTQGDGAFLLVFTNGDTVVAEVPLYGQAFYFDESVESVERETARFRVARDDASVILVRPE